MGHPGSVQDFVAKSPIDQIRELVLFPPPFLVSVGVRFVNGIV